MLDNRTFLTATFIVLMVLSAVCGCQFRIYQENQAAKAFFTPPQMSNSNTSMVAPQNPADFWDIGQDHHHDTPSKSKS